MRSEGTAHSAASKDKKKYCPTCKLEMTGSERKNRACDYCSEWEQHFGALRRDSHV